MSAIYFEKVEKILGGCVNCVCVRSKYRTCLVPQAGRSHFKSLCPNREFMNNVEAEAPILWPPDTKSQLIGKDIDSGKD